MYRISKLFTIFNKILGRGGRYSNLFDIIDRSKYRRIMEIGTWNGMHAARMIKTAQRHSPSESIEYYGFDLFEMITKEKKEKELSKAPPPIIKVKKKLEGTGARIYLFQGDTAKTLPENVKKLPCMDFIFIDGGHSIETIRNDWKYSRMLMNNKTVVVFDDYFRSEDSDIKNIGCQKVIDNLDRSEFEVLHMKPEDRYYKKPYGWINVCMVRVSKKSKRIL